MKLTKELITYCKKSFRELRRAMNAAPARTDGSDSHRIRPSVDWDVQRLVDFGFGRWYLALLRRLELLDLPELPLNHLDFSDTDPAKVWPALESVQRLADKGSLEALEALCELALSAARMVRRVERLKYAREHPYPWQKGGAPAAPHEETPATRAPRQVTDAEVSDMLRDLGDITPSD